MKLPLLNAFLNQNFNNSDEENLSLKGEVSNFSINNQEKDISNSEEEEIENNLEEDNNREELDKSINEYIQTLEEELIREENSIQENIENNQENNLLEKENKENIEETQQPIDYASILKFKIKRFLFALKSAIMHISVNSLNNDALKEVYSSFIALIFYKQNRYDIKLETENKTIVGAINELKEEIESSEPESITEEHIRSLF